MHPVWTARDAASGLSQTRYQQYVNGARVYGGQLTIWKNKSGGQIAVIGSHYPKLAPTNRVKVGGLQARAAAVRQVGAGGTFNSDVLINPVNGRLFYKFEVRRFDSRWVMWIDASTGATLRKFNALAHHETVSDPGIGVKGDTKQIDTTFISSTHALQSGDNRQKTYDARNRTALPGRLFTDVDGTWNNTSRTSPGQRAGVDAHYYANVTDDFYRSQFNRNSLNNSGMQMVSTVHYSKNYDNAFWNGAQMVYGDGSNTAGGFRELSGGLDVVAHELTHGVTDFTSDLVYQNESGALNEAFSDMMGNSTEYYAAANALDPSVAPDWYIGEDVYISPASNVVPGFRNMADPAEDGDPDHYSERYTGTADNGGVHSNSGIPNHAYYLLVNGGSNAGQARGHAHTGPAVSAIGVAKAQQIFYKAFTSLPSNATMSQARAATITAAGTLYGEGSAEQTSTANAWSAVGVN